MKIVVGIDARDVYVPTIELLNLLQFLKPNTTLLHVAGLGLSLSHTDTMLRAGQAAYAKAAHNAGLAALDRAMSIACPADLHPKMKLVFGRPADMLIAEADRGGADLVAVRATHQGMWGSSYLGSISGALAISCKSSILITKDEIGHGGSLRAVLATDQSPFAEQCIDRFLQLRPLGISEINVVSAYQIDDVEAEVLPKALQTDRRGVSLHIEEALRANNDRSCKKLNDAGYKTTSTVAQGATTDVIRHAMQETKSDLVIVGSQGAGRRDYCLIGSVSLHQAIGEPYPVLIVRP